MSLPANTSTWTKAQYQSAVASDISGLSVGQVAALTRPDLLSAAAFGGFTAAQIPSIAISWAAMSAAQINALTNTAFAAITVGAISQITSVVFGQLSNAHLAALTVKQIGALTTAQIQALSAAQLAVLPAADLAALSAALVRALSAGQIAALSASQLGALTAAQFGLLSATQLAGITTTAAAGLTLAQIGALSDGITKLSTSTIATISAATLAQISPWQLADLTAQQIAALTTAQIAALTAAQVAHLSEGQLYAMGTKAQSLTNATLAGLTQPTLMAIYPQLSASQIAALSSAQGALVTTAIAQAKALLSGLGASGLLSEVKAVATAGQSIFSYQGVLAVLQGLSTALGSGKLTAAQFADLKTLTTAVGTVDGTSSYLYNVLNALVNGNAFNATWTGGATSSAALGNLAVGTSATAFKELIGKWFLGTDLPSWTSASAWTTQSVALYTNASIVASDPTQGGIGDCYLISALVETALEQPNLLASMFTDNGNGTVGVRFYSPTGTALYFTVNGAVPGYVASTVSGAAWVTLIEKAYVAYNAEVSKAADAYASINGGWAGGLTAITGKTTTSLMSYAYASAQAWATKVKAAVLTALSASEEVLFGSFINDTDASNGKTDLVSSHMFAVTGYDTATGDFILRNPWGASGGSSWNGTFEQSIGQLWGGTSGASACSGIIIADGTSPAGSVVPTYAAGQLASAISATSAGAGSVLSLASQLAATQTANVLAVNAMV